MIATKDGLRRMILALSVLSVLFAASARATAQGDCSVGEVGSEVKSTNTPGGGGGLESQGLTGERTPWMIVHAAPSTGGTAVVNIHIVYYHCQICRDKAKKAQEEAKKKAEEEKKRKAEEAKKKKPGEKPPVGPDVPTFDPRTHELKGGKVVPKTPKSEDHSNCPMPDKFECSEHYQWWLANHEHWAKPADVKGHDGCDKPEKFECGEHYAWWLKNHKHRTAAEYPPVDREYRYDGMDRKIRRVEAPPADLNPKSLAPLDGAQIVLTGTVVAGEMATASVLDGNGALLAGVVLALPDGQKVQTDGRGHATFRVPYGKEALTLLIGGTLIQKSAWAWNSGAKLDSPRLALGEPVLEAPPIVQPGQPVSMPGQNLPHQASVRIDGQSADLLASSPTSIVVDMPSLTPGNHWVSLAGDGQLVDAQSFDAVALEVDPPKTMAIGQRATYHVRVVGTRLPVEIALTNLTPATISLEGTARAGFVKSTGGGANRAEIDVRALAPGPIRLPCSVVGVSPSGR